MSPRFLLGRENVPRVAEVVNRSLKAYFTDFNVASNLGKVCTISFERPVKYLSDAWHVFPPKYEAWTHFNRP